MTLGGMRVGGVFRMFGGQHHPLPGAAAGEIVGLGRMEEAKTGQTLANGAGPAASELPTSVRCSIVRCSSRSGSAETCTSP